MTKKGNSPLIILLVVVLILGAVLANLMQWNKLREEQALVVQEEQALEVSEARLSSLRALAAKEEQMRADLELLNQMMPEEPQEDDLIRDLQSGADLSGMHFIHVRFSGRNVAEGYVEMPVDTAFDGTYHELLYFLDYLKVYERAVRINELRLDEKQDSDDMSVNIRASMFYAAEAE
ncbi:MAG: type 4a pilus biogenesis protein PilO [Bacillota bacterium]|nr:type 4a pilus biogenesis protein PilO [Bacillota bacterium]